MRWSITFSMPIGGGPRDCKVEAAVGEKGVHVVEIVRTVLMHCTELLFQIASQPGAWILTEEEKAARLAAEAEVEPEATASAS